MASPTPTTPTLENTTPLFASLLPTYLAIKGLLLETAHIANNLLLESTADDERLQLYNATIVAAPPTAAIFFLPLRLPTIAKAIDVDYIGSSNHAFFILRGAPGNHFTHAAFVGYSDGQPDIPLVPGAPERILLHGKWNLRIPPT